MAAPGDIINDSFLTNMEQKLDEKYLKVYETDGSWGLTDEFHMRMGDKFAFKCYCKKCFKMY